mgnify:CR=1 FL=1
MAKPGFIKLHRQIIENELYREPRKFSKLEAWLYILLNAKYKEETEVHYGTEVIIPIGSFATSCTQLARAWGWDKKAVIKFLDYLTQESMISRAGTKIDPKTGTKTGTIINIENWAFYQGDGTKTGTKSGTKSDPQKPSSFLLQKEDKNIYSELLSFWNQQGITIHRKLTEDMTKAIDTTLKAYTQKEITQAIARYAKAYHDKDYFFKYNWTLVNFLKQKNALPDFLDDGQKWLSYKNAKATKEPDKPKTDLDAYEFNPSWREGELPL